MSLNKNKYEYMLNISLSINYIKKISLKNCKYSDDDH